MKTGLSVAWRTIQIMSGAVTLAGVAVREGLIFFSEELQRKASDRKKKNPKREKAGLCPQI